MGIFYILGLLLIGYVLGIVFCNRPFSFLANFLKNPPSYWDKFRNLFRSWNDWLFVLAISLFVIYFNFYLGKSLNIGDKIQSLIVIGTFSSVFFVTVIKDNASKHRNRPRIKVEFNDQDSNYYHQTIMMYGAGGLIEYFPSYYIRLNVENVGKKTMRNVEVVLEDIEPRPEKFMSLNLSWAGFIVSTRMPGDIKRRVHIPQEQSRVVDVIEVTEPEQTKGFLRKLEREIRGSDEEKERLKKLSKGFRSCSIKPNTLSDISPVGKYTFHLGIYADNTEPKFIKLFIEYAGIWGTEGIEGMRSKYLKVKLLD